MWERLCPKETHSRMGRQLAAVLDVNYSFDISWRGQPVGTIPASIWKKAGERAPKEDRQETS